MEAQVRPEAPDPIGLDGIGGLVTEDHDGYAGGAGRVGDALAEVSAGGNNDGSVATIRRLPRGAGPPARFHGP